MLQIVPKDLIVGIGFAPRSKPEYSLTLSAIRIEDSTERDEGFPVNSSEGRCERKESSSGVRHYSKALGISGYRCEDNQMRLALLWIDTYDEDSKRYILFKL